MSFPKKHRAFQPSLHELPACDPGVFRRMRRHRPTMACPLDTAHRYRLSRSRAAGGGDHAGRLPLHCGVCIHVLYSASEAGDLCARGMWCTDMDIDSAARRFPAAIRHRTLRHASWPGRVLVGAVRLYQLVLSPLMPPHCRHLPTCSDYAVEALREYGVLRGGWLAARRIARCHPFGTSGFDPVPVRGRASRRPAS